MSFRAAICWSFVVTSADAARSSTKRPHHVAIGPKMPKLRRYLRRPGVYIRSSLGCQILTYQVTSEGARYLASRGFQPEVDLPGDEIPYLLAEGHIFTGRSGPGALDDQSFGAGLDMASVEAASPSIDRRTLQTKSHEWRRQMTYQPNRWLMTDLHRRIVSASRQFSEYTVLLRPTRRHIFVRNFKLPSGAYIPEFFRPCFGVLARESDPDKKPCLVIETEDPGSEMRALYEKYGVLWGFIHQDQNRFVLDCTHGGTTIRVEETMGSLFKLLCAPLAWFERQVSFPQGSYVHSHSERVLRDAVKTLSPSYRIEIHHQVPLSYVLGYKDGLSPDEARILGAEIDAVITQSFEADPDGAVVLPVKIDLFDSHRADAGVIEKDQAVRALCKRFHVPLLGISPGDDPDSYSFDCEILGLPHGIAIGHDAQQWAGALAPFLGAAIRYAGRSF